MSQVVMDLRDDQVLPAQPPAPPGTICRFALALFCSGFCERRIRRRIYPNLLVFCQYKETSKTSPRLIINYYAFRSYITGALMHPFPMANVQVSCIERVPVQIAIALTCKTIV
jgi:hypothetical protein